LIFVFRCDASNKIGEGHLKRCLVLANYVKKKHKVYFMSKNYNKYIIEKLKKNFKVITINKNFSEKEEANFCYNYLRKINEKINVVTDHYGISFEWEKKISYVANKIIVLDDLLNRRHMCDMLINQNYFIKKDIKFLNKNTKYLIGPKYALINNSFLKYKSSNLKKKYDICIFFGSSDPANLTLKFSRIIKNLLPHYKVAILLGCLNSNIEKFKKIKNQKIFINLPSAAKIFKLSKSYIGSGGIVTWEKAFLGVPSLVIATAKNQILFNKKLHDQKLLTYIGYYKDLNLNSIKNHILNFLNNSKQLKYFKKNSQKLVDGMGVKRIVHEIAKI
jgi:UDP-2,4-diacetamido-2,4,6-trideoxy-beta-L-altropyranose hydrolase